MPMPVFLISSPFTKSSKSSHGMLVIIPAPSPLQKAHANGRPCCQSCRRTTSRAAPAQHPYHILLQRPSCGTPQLPQLNWLPGILSLSHTRAVRAADSAR